MITSPLVGQVCCGGPGCTDMPSPSSPANNCIGCGGGAEVIGPIDPNELIPPASVGDKGWIRKDNTLGFRILFENLPAAALRAQAVYITLPLGPNVDPNSFILGDFGFGDYFHMMPAGQQTFSQLLEVGDQFGVDVQVDAGLVPTMDSVFWTFQSLDTATGQPPLDIFAGFLPPNDPNVGDGEGFVNFTVSAGSATVTYDEIDLMADIVFDQNDPIETPMALLTIDADAPTTDILQVLASDEMHLIAEWGGTDLGSGLQNYTLLVSEDGGDYTPIVTDMPATAARFHGQLGSSYDFIVIGRDSVGNLENKIVSDTTVTFSPSLITNVCDSINYTIKEGVIIPLGIYRASQEITAAGSIQDPAQVEFTAGNQITLDPGFLVAPGAELIAKIEGCDELLLQNYTASLRTINHSPFIQQTNQLQIKPVRNAATGMIDLYFSNPYGGVLNLDLQSSGQNARMEVFSHTHLPRGVYMLSLSGERYPKGIYQLRLQSEQAVAVESLVVIE